MKAIYARKTVTCKYASLFDRRIICYTDRISSHIHTHPTTAMTLEACIAHAIHKDLDIIEAMPNVYEVPFEQLEPMIDDYIHSLQQRLVHTVKTLGEPYLKAKDAAGLCITCLRAGVTLPPEMMLKMCQTILQLSSLDATFIADAEDGTASIYYMKLSLAI